MCGGSLAGVEAPLDYRPFDIGLVHPGNCGPQARDRAYKRLEDSSGLEEIPCQCLHGIGKSWTYEQFLFHDRFGHCRIRGRRPYRAFDHMRMFRVKEDSVWAPISSPGTSILITEPYEGDLQEIAEDSWLWWELRFRLLEFRYPDLQLHSPAVDGTTKTILVVWAMPNNGVIG